MNVNMLCAVANITLEGKLSIVPENTLESNTKEYLDQFVINEPLKENQKILSQDFVNSIGEIEQNDYRKKWFLHKEIQFNGESNSDIQGFLFNYTNQVTSALENFLLALWFVKDNSINLRSFYTSFKDKDTPACLRIRMDNTVFMSDGEQHVMSFFEEDFIKAFNWLPIIERNQVSGKNFEKVNSDVLINESFFFAKDGSQETYDENNRFARSLRFITQARRQNFLPARISFFISAIEALVTSDDSSMTSQITERTAMFLEKNHEEQLEVKGAVRAAYKARSAYIHGDILKNGINNKIEKISQEIDQISRRLIIILLTDHPEIAALKGKNFTNWYKNKVLLK